MKVVMEVMEVGEETSFGVGVLWDVYPVKLGAEEVWLVLKGI